MFEQRPTYERRSGEIPEPRSDATFEGVSLPPPPGAEKPASQVPAKERADALSLSSPSRPCGAVTRLAGRALDWLASDPRAEISIVRAVGALGLDLVPFVGPLKKYADARAMFRDGDPLLKEEARKLVVIAAAEATFDTVTLGGSALIPDELLTYMRYARDAHRRIAGVSRASGLLPDPLSLAAGALLRVPAVRAAVDKLLSFAPPATHAA